MKWTMMLFSYEKDTFALLVPFSKARRALHPLSGALLIL